MECLLNHALLEDIGWTYTGYHTEDVALKRVMN